MNDPAPHEELGGVATLLAAWMAHRAEASRQPQGRLGGVLGSLRTADRRGLREAVLRAAAGRVDVAQEAGYLLGTPVDRGTPVMWPAVAVTVTRDLEVGIRVALLFEHADELWAEGWRFETADRAGGPHPYLHAQHIRGWGGASSVAFLPETPGLRSAPANESQPAFPLRGRSAVGLVAAVLGTLYGAPVALDIANLAGAGLRGGLRAEVEGLLTGT